VTRKTSPVWSDISASVHAGSGGKSSVDDGAILQNKKRGKVWNVLRKPSLYRINEMK
jgi:hypothetical protein